MIRRQHDDTIHLQRVRATADLEVCTKRSNFGVADRQVCTDRTNSGVADLEVCTNRTKFGVTGVEVNPPILLGVFRQLFIGVRILLSYSILLYN